MNRLTATMIAMSAMMSCGSAAALAQVPPAGASDTQQADQNAASAAPLWLMSCSNQLQPEQLLCEVSQSIVMRQGNQSQRVATASFTRVAGKPETAAAFTLPYGVSLTDPVKILIDEKQVGSLTWQSCDAGGCYADAKVDAQWLKALRDGKTMTTALKSRDGRDLAFSFQLNGISKAEAMLP
ncbi:invasion associated locus B family protein [Ochrobactrum sp. Q0168]|uniref:invasion associated locus B family protein n=1 Tax=Ochrobactrum sp. Q0168 TaxID=2793241 RepID=UPI0018EBFCEB|nr:invasion associated locus B family protein [Ochrobactrum sp. Q0168]